MSREYRRKRYESDYWYHVWNRGFGGRNVFAHDADRRVFLDCFARHLGQDQVFDERGRGYRQLRYSVELGAYCLMPNHYHLLVRTRHDPAALTSLMRHAMTAYGMYFRDRHGARKRLFGSQFQADIIGGSRRLRDAVVYVHLNFEDDPGYAFSSHRHFVTGPPPAWLNGAPRLINSIGGLAAYERALARRREIRAERRKVEARLAELDAIALELRGRRR